MGTAFSAEAAAGFAERIIASPGPATPAECAEAARLVGDDPVTAALGTLGFDLTDGAGERVSYIRASAGLVPEVEIEAAGYVTAARVSPVELWRFLLPVCQVAVQRAHDANRRFLLGIAGPGASGKSVLAALLQRLVGLCSGGAVRAALCPLDGFHRPNAWLDAHTAPGADGEPIPLRRFKGAPQTFDAESFVGCVKAAAEAPELSLPRYDRRIHDPVPGGLRIAPDDGIVIIEGNYLLLDLPPWHEIADILDLALYLDVSLEVVKEAMVGRHVRGGRSPENALAHFGRVDRRNYEICSASAGRADLILRRDVRQRIVDVALPI